MICHLRSVVAGCCAQCSGAGAACCCCCCCLLSARCALRPARAKQACRPPPAWSLGLGVGVGVLSLVRGWLGPGWAGPLSAVILVLAPPGWLGPGWAGPLSAVILVLA